MNSIIREKASNKLLEIINDKNIVQQIENSIYKYSIEHSYGNQLRTYTNKLTNLYVNLDIDSYIENKYLLPTILSGEIDLDNIAYLNPQELYPAKWESLIEKKTAQDKFLFMQKPEINTELYTCGKCKNNKCSYFEAQTRAADEPTTIFITCITCGNKWKMN